MIEALNIETAHRYNDTLPMLLKCRYNEFILRQKYAVPSYNKMEYDQYDTPAAVYFAWKDEEGGIKAGMRIHPTDRPYMIKDMWPQALHYIDLPNSQTIWEMTRFFVDSSIVAGPMRRQAHGELLCALLEFALYHGITNYIGIAPPVLWDFTYRRCGWPAKAAGKVIDIGFTEKVQVCILDVSQDILEKVRATMNIKGTTLSCLPLPIELKNDRSLDLGKGKRGKSLGNTCFSSKEVMEKRYGR
jgi:acyl homoserine lactone synthase